MTGLIYVVIIALWAAVLIPIWLRRHDQISEVRSTARFSSAMKSLGKGEKKAVGVDRRAQYAAADPREFSRQAAAKRRAIVLGVLSGALALMLVLAIAGVVPRIAPIVMAIIVLAFVVATALTSAQRRPATSANTSRRVPEYGLARDDDYFDDDYDDSYDDYREIAYADEVADVAYPRSRGVRPQTRRTRDAQVAAAMDDFLAWDPWEGEPEETGDDWSAVPTTLPTYVNAPRATRVRRPIERDRDWSGEAMVEAARGMRRPRVTVDDLADDRYALESNSAAYDQDSTSELPALRPEETRRAAGE